MKAAIYLINCHSELVSESKTIIKILKQPCSGHVQDDVKNKGALTINLS